MHVNYKSVNHHHANSNNNNANGNQPPQQKRSNSINGINVAEDISDQQMHLYLKQLQQMNQASLLIGKSPAYLSPHSRTRYVEDNAHSGTRARSQRYGHYAAGTSLQEQALLSPQQPRLKQRLSGAGGGTSGAPAPIHHHYNGNAHHVQRSANANNNAIQHKQLPNRTANPNITLQHYQHYYSYVYHRLPSTDSNTVSPDREQAAMPTRRPNRQLPQCNGSSLPLSKKHYSTKHHTTIDYETDEEDFAAEVQATGAAMSNALQENQHLLGKTFDNQTVAQGHMPNNNIALEHNNIEWLPNGFYKSKSTNDNHQKQQQQTNNWSGQRSKYAHAYQQHHEQLQLLQKAKQQKQHQHQPLTTQTTQYYQNHSFQDEENLAHNGTKTKTAPQRRASAAIDIPKREEEYASTESSAEASPAAEIPLLQRTKKLPATPRQRKHSHSAKKPSPPAPRVLLYNLQSPRPSLRHFNHNTTATKKPNAQALRTKGGAAATTTEEPAAEGSDHRHCATKNTNELRIISPVRNIPKEELDRVLYSAKSAAKKTSGSCSSSDFDDDFDDDLDNLSLCGSSTEDSSGSEDNYGAFTSKLKALASPPHSAASETFRATALAADTQMVNPESLLVPSLFPNVPPYLAFSTHIEKGPEVPSELHRVLKWRVSNVMPRVVRSVLANSGVRLLKKTNDWMGVWGKHMKSPCFKAIRPYQKINHLPGSFKIGRKDSCWKNLQKQMAKHSKKEFAFMPKTYVIPLDTNLLRRSWPKYAQRNTKWIIKPPASARGTGIRVVHRWTQIPKRKPLIVQKYVERPLLINGSKFDIRLYVLVTSINPLRVYMYQNGLARFASVKYSDKSDTLNDRCMHLTNYSINKFSSNYAKNEDVNACDGHKWTLKALWKYLEARGIRTDILWDTLRTLVLRTILAGENSIHNTIKMNLESKYSCFELFGFDVLLDAELIPWLLEVNISPSLHSDLPLDAHVKAPLVQSVLNTALYNVPPKLSFEKQRDIAQRMQLPQQFICFDRRLYINYLSRTEKIKHNTFTRKSLEDRNEYINTILDNLTPDDVRCLIVAEDELARSQPLERIFPTHETWRYLKYTDSPRYYNRLLDAWETRYANKREEGIEMLRGFCEMNYHLEISTPPAKKDSNVNDPCGEKFVIYPGNERQSAVGQNENSTSTS